MDNTRFVVGILGILAGGGIIKIASIPNTVMYESMLLCMYAGAAAIMVGIFKIVGGD